MVFFCCDGVNTQQKRMDNIMILPLRMPGEPQGSEDSCIIGQAGQGSEQPDLAVCALFIAGKLD